MQYVLDAVYKKEKASGSDPTKVCRFDMEQRMQCLDCEKVQYKSDDTSSLIIPIPAVAKGVTAENRKIYAPVNLEDCIAKFFEADLRQFTCPIDQLKTTASFLSRFKTYPEFLFCVASRFVLGEGWVMEKLNVEINAPNQICLDQFRGSGPQSDETLFPENKSTNLLEFDVNDLNQLMSMGFPENRCKRALINVGKSGVEAATAWLFEHMEDPDIDDPLTNSIENKVSLNELLPLMDMGFTQKQAEVAMKQTVITH